MNNSDTQTAEGNEEWTIQRHRKQRAMKNEQFRDTDSRGK
jgi:hypothetical protein